MSKKVILKRAHGEAVLYDGSYESIEEIINLYKKYFNINCYNCYEEKNYKRSTYLLEMNGNEFDLHIGDWYIFDKFGVRNYPDKSEPLSGLPKQKTIHDKFYFIDE